MNPYSTKSRRRMHAIPAALALTCAGLLWLFSQHTEATPLFSAATLPLWHQDCRDCAAEPQFDVLQGDVVHLSAGGEFRLSRYLHRSAPQAPANASLHWQWSVDPYVDGGTLLRITLYTAETEQWPARTLHYVWDSTAARGTSTAITDFEYRIVVTGQDSRAERWYEVKRNLSDDWQALYAEPLPALEKIEIGLGMPGADATTGAFIGQLGFSLPVPPLQQAAVTGE